MELSNPEQEDNKDNKIVFGKYKPYLSVQPQIIWHYDSENITENGENWTSWKYDPKRIQYNNIYAEPGETEFTFAVFQETPCRQQNVLKN